MERGKEGGGGRFADCTTIGKAGYHQSAVLHEASGQRGAGFLLEEANRASTGRKAFILSPVATGIYRFNYGCSSVQSQAHTYTVARDDERTKSPGFYAYSVVVLRNLCAPYGRTYSVYTEYSVLKSAVVCGLLDRELGARISPKWRGQMSELCVILWARMSLIHYSQCMYGLLTYKTAHSRMSCLLSPVLTVEEAAALLKW